MDDINCGVADIDEARRLLRAIELILNSLGLRLNSAKTLILSARETLDHFWVHENRAVTILTNLVRIATRGSASWTKHRDYARRRYRKFSRLTRTGQWDKVYKRYFTLHGLLRDPSLQRNVPDLLDHVPSLRGSICRYYSLLGPTQERLRHLAGFLRSGRCLDDASLFEVVRTLVAWKGQLKGARRDTIVGLVPVISSLGSESAANTEFTVSGVSSSIWLLAKYGEPQELAVFLDESHNLWTRSSWTARQVAASIPLLAISQQEAVRGRLVQSGLVEALRVLASLDEMGRLTTLDRQLRSYLLYPPTAEHPYPLGKAIVARAILKGRLSAAERKDLLARLRELVDDPCYLAMIRRRA